MDDRERAKRNRPSIILLVVVMVPSFLLFNNVIGLGFNWSFLIALALAVGINLAIKRPWDQPSDDWPGVRNQDQDEERRT